MTSETQDKLSWLAFRYVADELDFAEASEFESLLLTDQAAREAVATAVQEATQLHHAFVESGVVSVASPRATSRRNATRVTIVAAGSCLTLLMAFWFVGTAMPIPTRVATRVSESDSAASPAQLAFAWAEARDGLADLALATGVELSDPSDFVLDVTVESGTEQPLMAPSWMLAAITRMDMGGNSDRELQE